jgi:hypothetical protein
MPPRQLYNCGEFGSAVSFRLLGQLSAKTLQSIQPRNTLKYPSTLARGSK